MTNTIEILGKIMGSTTRVKLMRLFMFHPGHGFTRDELVKKTKANLTSIRAELVILEKAGFITKRDAMRSSLGRNGKPNGKKKKVIAYALQATFPLIEPFHALLLDSELVALPDLPQRLKAVGKIKLLVVSGIFTRDTERALDLLIVGDKMDGAVFQKQIALLESEIGKELRYAIFTTDEFMYRMKMYDKLLRDVFDYPHQKLVNQLSISELS
jgi:hypothetical protein